MDSFSSVPAFHHYAPLAPKGKGTIAENCTTKAECWSAEIICFLPCDSCVFAYELAWLLEWESLSSAPAVWPTLSGYHLDSSIPNLQNKNNNSICLWGYCEDCMKLHVELVVLQPPSRDWVLEKGLIKKHTPSKHTNVEFSMNPSRNNLDKHDMGSQLHMKSVKAQNVLTKS